MANQHKIGQAKEDILDLITKNKGICSILLYETFGGKYSRSHIIYILQTMERGLLIKTVKEDKYTYCYLYSDDPNSEENQRGRRKYLLQNLDRKSEGKISEVLAVVKANQGITKAGIAKKLSIYRNTSGYYISLLERYGFIQVKEQNNLNCCFTSDYDRDFTYLSESERQLLEVIMAHPGLMETELRGFSDQGQQLLYRNLKRLLSKKKIQRDKKESHAYRYYPVKTRDSEFDLFLGAGNGKGED